MTLERGSLGTNFSSLLVVRAFGRGFVNTVFDSKRPSSLFYEASEIGDANLDDTQRPPSMTKRIRNATKIAKRLGTMPIPRNMKIKLVRCSALASAWFGSDFVFLSNSAMAGLRSVLVDAVGSRSKRGIPHCCDFHMCSGGRDLHAEIVRLAWKVLVFRRGLSKSPKWQSNVRPLY